MVNQLRVLKITLSKLGDNTGAVCLVDIGGVNLTPKPYSKTPPPHKPRNLYLIFLTDRSGFGLVCFGYP